MRSVGAFPVVMSLGVTTVMVVSLSACTPDVSPTYVCNVADISVNGDVGGVDVGRKIPLGANVYLSGSGNTLFVTERNGLSAMIETDVIVKPDGEAQPARGWIRFASGGAWYHLGDGSTMKHDSNSQASLVLFGLRRLPSCDAGASVDMIATYCPGVVNTFCEAGATFAQAGLMTKIAPTSGGFGMTRSGAAGILTGDAAILITYSDADQAMEGFFVLPAGHPDGGALYCAGAGKRELEDPKGLNGLFTLQTFTRIGGLEEGQVSGSTVTMSICL